MSYQEFKAKHGYPPRISGGGEGLYNYYHLAASQSQLVLSPNGGAVLGSVIINNGWTGTLTIFDAATGPQCTAGNTIAVVTTTTTGNIFLYDVVTKNGVAITTTGTVADATIGFR